MSQNQKLKNSKKELSYEDIGKMLVNIYESGYLDRKKFYKMSLIKGLLQGFGGVLGATILVAILLWILSLASNIPFLERAVQNIKQTLQTQKQ